MTLTPATATDFAPLRTYLAARGQFRVDEFDWMRTLFQSARLESGEFVHRAGDVASYAAFVTRGCLRSYVIDVNGKEHTVQFAPEDWWLADHVSLQSHQPSQFFYQAIEDTELLMITPAGHQSILDRVPAYAGAFQSGLQKHAAAKDLRIVDALSATAEERYVEFLRTYPSVAARVPQWMVASYLGLTPETLSRIRKRVVK